MAGTAPAFIGAVIPGAGVTAGAEVMDGTAGEADTAAAVFTDMAASAVASVVTAANGGALALAANDGALALAGARRVASAEAAGRRAASAAAAAKAAEGVAKAGVAARAIVRTARPIRSEESPAFCRAFILQLIPSPGLPFP
jgi:hypothetical protein